MVIGSRLKANKVAKQNLKMIYPNKTNSEINKITASVWQNLGHNFAEFPLFSTINKEQFLSYVKIIGLENIMSHIDEGKPVLLFSAHYSNWEVISAFLKHYKIKTNMIYRKTNNPYLNEVIINARSSEYFIMHSKGRRNAMKVVEGLKEGITIASFVDQKLHEGIKVPFLGKDAMSPPLLAQLAHKYKYPLIGVHVRRIGNLKYELVIEPELKYKKINNKEKQINEIMTSVNKRIEHWVNSSPGQWFWVHNRWLDHPNTKR